MPSPRQTNERCVASRRSRLMRDENGSHAQPPPLGTTSAPPTVRTAYTMVHVLAKLTRTGCVDTLRRVTVILVESPCTNVDGLTCALSSSAGLPGTTGSI